MVEDVYEVIDYINNSSLKKELDEVKKRIKNDEECKSLIKKFEEAKDLYERHNSKKEFVIAKENLLKNKNISKYIKLQNEVNMLTIQINNRLKKITNQRV